jgi:hypothetical protein
MTTITEKIRARLYDRLGIDPEPAPGPHIGVVDLRRTEWSAEFEQLMRDRLVMGALRYGRLGVPGKPQYDRTADVIRRVKKYAATGNLEHLVDVANLALAEYVEGRHPKRHFNSVDDGEHTKIKGAKQ